ncbi:chromosome segregation protein-like protein [Byssothecium circinans]|uniref:Chromosome segregation protein-like protein n=1 Tax=Byssothecium circinans TaxID=147558 RepID=A0A6A5UF38_9PLEO|nr:chromosome segregation protein-like protein [Byssothecium circinans]
MASPQQLRGRYAHAPGPTCLSYTPDGKKLITAGVDNFCRVFSSGSDEEPTNVDDCEENNAAIAAGNNFFVTVAENGNISRYSLEDHKFEYYLERVSLPARDVTLSPDEKWVAVASDEQSVLLVNTGGRHERQFKYLSDHEGSVKHVAFDKTGSQLAVSSTNGNVYIYSLESSTPKLVKKLDGMIKRQDQDAESSSRVLWHPDGRAFAVPTPLREIQVISTADWEKQRSFKTQHSADITAAAWSPNGGLLATTSSDLNLCLWDTKTQKLLKTYDDVKAAILAMVWHPTENILSYTNSEGQLYIHNDFVPTEHAHILQRPTQPAPFFHDPAEGRTNGATSKITNGTTHTLPERRHRDISPDDDLDDILGPEFQDEEMDDFIIDDDGAGYAPALNGHGKRTNGHLDPLLSRAKRPAYSSAVFQPQIHDPFQPGATPWRGNRRMLCCSLFGYVSTISQENGQHTVELKFSDKGFRDAKIDDIYGYDKAALSTKGALLSCQPRDGHPAMIYYRPHGTWTRREDWRTYLPIGESVTSIALSESYAVVTTSTNYIRIYSLFGLPIRVYRQKSSPAVTCAAWRDYVLTIGNGPVGGDGTSQLLYTIENIKRDEIYQSEDIVALPPNTTLTSVFFSKDGDPYIYDSDGVLLTLLRWRTSGQARWVPMLDTKTLSRRLGGGKEESYWPVGVQTDENNNHVFECFIIKGSERYPSNPPPLSSQFPLEVPVSSTVADEDDPTAEQEQNFVLASILYTQLSETLSHTRPTLDQENDLMSLEEKADVALLRMLPPECRNEQRNPKALELVELMRDSGDKYVKGALKAAEKFSKNPELLRKIRRVQARKERARLNGGVEEEEVEDLDEDEF